LVPTVLFEQFAFEYGLLVGLIWVTGDDQVSGALACAGAAPNKSTSTSAGIPFFTDLPPRIGTSVTSGTSRSRQITPGESRASQFARALYAY
jgi:hypothetical protein